MNKIYKIIVESLKIVLESFLYLFKEINYLFLHIKDNFLSLFGLNKTNRRSQKNIRDLIIKGEKTLLENKSKSLASEEISVKNSKPSEDYQEKILLVDQKSDSLEEKQDEEENKEDVEENISSKAKSKRDVNKNIKGKKSSKFTKTFIIFFLIISALFAYFTWDLPDYKVLENYEPPLTTRVYSEEGNLVSELALEKRLFVPLDSIPNVVKDAFISAEDKNFRDHFGIDFMGLSRATFNNVMYLAGASKNIEGASTITQQVVKNFLLSNDRTIRRKVREAILTFQVERAFSKDHILELYLNEIYLGRSSYGVSTASLNYFNKSITDLNIQEAAFLASLPKAPSKYDPRLAYKASKERRDWVIGRMLIDGKITKEEAEKAIESPIDFVDKAASIQTSMYSSYSTEEIRKDLIKTFGYDKVYGGGLIIKTTISDNLQQYAYKELRRGIINFDSKNGYRGVLDRTEKDAEYLNATEGNAKVPNWLTVLKENELSKKYRYDILPWRVAIAINVTKNKVNFGLLDGTKGSLDLSLNLWAKDARVENKKVKALEDFNNILQSGDIILVENNEKAWYLRQIPKVNGALIAMNPQTGEVLAMQGGFSFALSQFNRATQAYRQPGSVFKPFVYLSAIQRGRKTTDKILDAPILIETEEQSWRPRNNANAYGGFVTLRNALEQSRNLATIRIANNIGLDAISKTVMKLGLYDTPIDNLSEVLGSKEVTLLNIVNSYASLVNGGKKVTPNLIRQVQDKDGAIIFKNDTRVCLECNDITWKHQTPPELEDKRPQVINPVDAAIVVNLLQGVVERGTGRRTRFSGYNIGGKTGTTNNVKDAWFIGFTPNLVVGIYFGEDNPTSLGNEEGATSIAVPVFANFMRYALKGQESLPFRTPEGLEMMWVNYKTGEPGEPGQPGVILDIFKQGTSEGQRIITEDGRLQEITNKDSTHESISEDGIY